MNRDAVFERVARAAGFQPDGEIRVGGHYVPLVRDGRTLYISGQIPRVGNQVTVAGRVGGAVGLADAQRAAEICALRALALLQRHLGSLDRVQAVLRINVYVQCTEDFTQHSEVADAASDLLHQVLGEAGAHTRTSVGVYQLPKNATVELDMVACAAEGASA